MTLVVLVGAALALPGIASAHGGGSYTAQANFTGPTVDGVVTIGEWGNVPVNGLLFDFGSGSVANANYRFQRTATELYVAVVVQDPNAGLIPSLAVYFDDDHSNTREHGEDAWLASVGQGTGEDFFVDLVGPGSPTQRADAVDGGTSDTVAAGTINGTGEVMFELRHPVCTTDDTHDICTSVGPLGINFQYQRGVGAPIGGFATAPGTGAFGSLSNWADLTLEAALVDDISPQVTVTAPTAGTVVSGTITVTADASDNVGVDSVEFLYFDGEGPGVGTDYSLGVDRDPPYEVIFDSTQYPDTIPLDATMYAIARDAAGNTTQAGNGITVDNSGAGPATVTGASIAITGDATAGAGAAAAPIAGIPIDAITGDDGAPSSTPLGGIPLGGIPLGGIPLGGIPLGGIPLGGIGFTSTNLDQNGLGGVPLSTIPLDSMDDTWQKRLDANPAFAGTPVQSVTLAEVLDTSVVTSPTPVTLDDLDLASSPLGGIPLGGIALGGLPLGGIPLGGIATSSTSENLAAWCEFINQQPGFSCTNPNTLSSQTMIGIALQGVPLGGIPLGGIPLGGIDLSDSPLGGIPLGGIPLGGIDLTDTPLGGIPLGGIPLGGIDLASSPLGGIPLGGISTSAKDEILTCPTGGFTCADTATLAQAFAAGAVKDSATVEDIGYYCVPGTPANSACRAGETPILLQDFVLDGLPPDATLEDLLGTILAETAYDWESLPLPGFPIQDFASDGGINNYAVTFTVTGDRAGFAPATVAVKIPPDARYVPKSSNLPSLERVLPDPTMLDGNVLQWELEDLPLNLSLTLTFDVRPGLTLQTETATAEITAGSLPAVQSPTPASTRIRDPWTCVECFEFAVDPDTLYLGYTTYGDNVDTFTLEVPEPGTQVTVRLSHLSLDNDLVVFGPVPPPLRVPKPSTSVLQAGDVAPDLQQRSQAVVPEILGDVPVDPPEGLGLLGASDNRGLADEEVTFIVPEDSDGTITIRISSFDGAYSNEPWMLRIEESPPIALPAGCEAPMAMGGNTVTPRALPTTLPSGGSTLYLHNSNRYSSLYGSANENALWGKLETMAARGDAAGGAVIPIDAIPEVAAKLPAWTVDPCSPGANNDVVRALGEYLDDVPASYKYIVLVGDWTVIPTGLILDNSLFANERSYASTFFGTAQSTQYLSSYALGYLPSDDPYGDTSYSGFGPYVPEVAVGRLVESHAEIMGQLQQYLDRSGAIDPSTALVTGYDFLRDGAQQISAGLKANVANPSELINDTWTKSQLLAALFPATNPPVIDSINAHYDHYRALPADQNAAGTEIDLFETSDLQPTSGRLVITIGCHSGTPVSDGLFDGPFETDWSQSYAAKGAIGYIAQSTFGLGETAGVAYSEKLHALLAERLDGSLTVGHALVFAKQEYSAMPLQGGYDVKVIDGSGLYGLPMYRVGTGAGLAAPPLPLPLVTDAATGLSAAAFNISPTFNLVTASTGRYYTVGGNASFQNRRPIEPFTKLDVTQPTLVAHGALITSAVSDDQANFDAAFSRAIEDSAALSPELVGDATSPTRLQSIATFSTPTGRQQRLVLSTGQFLADGVPDALGVGTQRLFRSLGGVVLYAPDNAEDFRPPTFGPVQAFAASNSTIGFAVDVRDESGDPADVKRVVALYKDSSGAWRSIDLSHVATSARWSGGGAFAGSTAEWFLQAVDAFGNVGVISNKASIDPVAAPTVDPGISAVVTSTFPKVNGWYTGDATVTISGGEGIESSVDGSFFTADSAPSVAGTGLHSVAYRNSSGAQGTTIVPIDVTRPVVNVSTESAPGVVEIGQTSNFGFFSCADAGSGIASCEASPVVDTSSLTPIGGTRSVNVNATDRVGLTSDPNLPHTAHYRVVYAFRGFFQPVDNLPVLNSVKAGNGVPVRFSLGGNQGLSIFLTGYPKSARIPCDASDPVDDIESTVTAGNSSLSYSAGDGRYTYTWKTEKAWAGTCRQLILKFADGTQHSANFKFK